MDNMAWMLLMPPLLLAIIVHEVAHGLAAEKLGDPTARLLGRLTLNPIPHIDPVGSVIFPALQILTTGSVFIAWAKPVPVNMSRFKKPFEAFAWVAVAGPASNLVQAAIWAIPIWWMTYFGAPPSLEAFAKMAIFGVQINIVLMCFNMLPVPPLDGSRIVAAVLPAPKAVAYLRSERYTFIGLLLLLGFAPGVLHAVLNPMLNFFLRLLLPGA